MARLLQHFLPVFSFGLALDEKVAAGQAGDPAAAVVARARELIDRAKAAAQADGNAPTRSMAPRSRLSPGSTRSWRATRPGWSRARRRCR